MSKKKKYRLRITRNMTELQRFKFKFILMLMIIDIITVFTCYFMMPLIQNFPPLSESLKFQNAVQPLNHLEEYAIVFLLGFLIHYICFKVLMRRIYSYFKKLDSKANIPYKEIKIVRKDCINIPYKFFAIQMLCMNLIGVIANIVMLASPFSILKFTLTILVMSSLVSVILLVGTQKFLYKILIQTYNTCNEYEKNLGYRISNSQNILFQTTPFIVVVLIVLSLIGYSKTVQQEGYATGNYYKGYIESLNIQPEEVSISELKETLNNIPLLDDSHYYFIIAPKDKLIYTSNPDGSISDFVLKYRDFFYKQTNGFLFENFGVDEQLYAANIKDSNGNTWYIGFKYPTVDYDLFKFYIEIIVLVLLLFSILLYVWSRNISINLIRTTNGLKNIVTKGAIDNKNILPIASNDEFGDLAYYYNKIQDLTANNIEQIQNNQNMLVEQERLASLGQMIGGISHNLKTPIMSIAGAAEGLTDLVTELDESIGDPEITEEDFHDIAKDMKEWITKIHSYTGYMSDIITAVKGQAVTLSEQEEEAFTVYELIKRVEILMKNELQNGHAKLEKELNKCENVKIEGNINSLVQVVNNLISNGIQSYQGKPDGVINITTETKGNKIILTIEDHGCGIPTDVKNKLFKEMITTKGKNGTGLGLFMSYSTIKGKFKGDMTFTSSENVGTKFVITLPIANI